MAITGQGPTVIAVAAGFLIPNSFFIALRCYVRARISKNFNYNDVFMMTALLTYASLVALVILGVKSGIGGHIAKATVAGIGDSLKYIWFLEIIYVLLTSVMKASIATTLLQWAKSRVHFWLLWGSIAVDVAISAVVVFYTIFQCQPVSYAWRFLDPTVKGKCLPFINEIYVGFALCFTTVALDMLFLFLPFFMLRGRGVNKRLTMIIYVIFGLGVLASIANFIRLAALFKLKKSADALFDAGPVFTWSAVEVSIGISVAGMLELSPLLRKWGVKGFEDSFSQLEDDMIPMKSHAMNPYGMTTTTDMGSNKYPNRF